MSWVIGLTGGIGTGKSTVSAYLADRYRLPILDADLYAREAVAVGSDGLAQIVHRYGSSMLLADGSLHRSALAEIIFTRPVERLWLEGVIHPVVKGCFVRDLAAITAPMVVAAIPLLFEAQFEALVSEVWVVACHEKTQLERLQQRDQLTPEQADQRLASQWPLATKTHRADLVLDNSGTFAHLQQQIDRAMAIRADGF